MDDDSRISEKDLNNLKLNESNSSSLDSLEEGLPNNQNNEEPKISKNTFGFSNFIKNEQEWNNIIKRRDSDNYTIRETNENNADSKRNSISKPSFSNFVNPSSFL